MEDRDVEYTIVPDMEDMQEIYDSLQMEISSIRTELSRIRRSIDINSSVEDHLIPLLSSMDCEGKVDIRPLLSKIAEDNGILREQMESLTQTLDDRKCQTRAIMKQCH